MYIVHTQKLTQAEFRMLIRLHPIKAIALDKQRFAERVDTLVMMDGPQAGYYYPPSPQDVPHWDEVSSNTYHDYLNLLADLYEQGSVRKVSEWPWK